MTMDIYLIGVGILAFGLFCLFVVDEVSIDETATGALLIMVWPAALPAWIIIAACMVAKFYLIDRKVQRR